MKVPKIFLDSGTLKRMLKPMPSAESPATSPEVGRRRYGGYNPPYQQQHHQSNNNARPSSQQQRFMGSR